MALPARAATAATAPTLRLFAAKDQVTVYQYGRRVVLDLGVWIAAQGGDFQLDVSRPDYDSSITATQVDSQTGDVLRTLPASAVSDFHGVNKFMHVTIRNRAGERVFNKMYTFCPNSFNRARVDDQGRVNSRYPFFCAFRFPFTKGSVWGIDDHWAVNPLSQGFRDPYARIPAGRYTAVVRVNRAYTGLLGIPEDQAVVHLQVRVVSTRPRPFGGGIGRAGLRPDTTVPARDANVPTVSEPDPDTLPDLVALPLWNARVFTHRHRDVLAFAATEWNAGPAPLVVEGFREPNTDVMDAFQYFFDAQGNPVGSTPAGSFEFDARRGHQHWHFEQLARYSLLNLAKTEVVRSHKQSFCIAPTDPVDLTAPRANWQPWSLGLGSACGGPSAIWIREDLDTGWGDTYYQFVAGQAFNISAVPNGWYYLRSEVNPEGLLQERSTTNDVEDRLVHLGGTPGHRTVLLAPWHGIRH
jgi:hypothetical protein